MSEKTRSMVSCVFQDNMVGISIIFQFKIFSQYVRDGGVSFDIRKILVIFRKEGQGGRGEFFGNAAGEEEGIGSNRYISCLYICFGRKPR